MIAQKYRILALLAANVIMFACVPMFAPVSAPVAPTFDPNSINTVIAQTAGAAATQTALMVPPTLMPTETISPTDLPTETPTATFFFVLPSLTPTPTLIKPGSSGADFECQIISQSPLDNTAIQHSSVFDVHWKVVNIGKKMWDSNNADYRYFSGEKMHRKGAFDLSDSVLPGGEFEVVVAMQAPAQTGTYTTTWKFTSGKDRFCPMSITIVVN